MQNMLLRVFALSLAGVLLVPAANATDIPVGYVSYDITGTNIAQIDIVNQTGPNSSTFPDTTFPVTNSVSLSSLSLTVDYLGGFSTVFGSSYFTLNADGLSFDGGPLSILNGPPSGLFEAIDAVLTGSFSTTSFQLNDGTTVTVDPGFTATISDPGGLMNGDFAIITPGGSGPPPPVPEPSTWVMMGTGLAGLFGAGRSRSRRALQVLKRYRTPFFALGLGCGLLLIPVTSQATVKLNALASPSSGVAGSSTVGVTGSGFPSGTISPANVSVSLSSVCGGSSTAATVSFVQKIIGTSNKIEFQIPGSLATGTYYVSVSGSDSNNVTFNSGTTCSALQVTHSSTITAACLPSSSLAVLSGSHVTAYVPNGYWEGGTTGIQAVSIEGGGSAISIPTTDVINSCSSNSVTGETVCVANNTHVYTITGTSVTNTLSDGANSSPSFSGGSAQTTGVAINALTNTAVLGIGVASSPARAGLQLLNLSNNSFGTPFASHTAISENMSVDPNRNLILSPNEESGYTLYKLDSVGNLSEFDSTIGIGSELDSAAEDCTTGIALSTVEFTGKLVIADLTQAVFTPPVAPSTVGTWTAPNQVVNFPEFVSFAAGTDGISVAAGSTHLGIVSGEFGGNSFGAFQLPATSGSGTPAFVDYVQANLPNTPDGRAFSAGFDPHTITAYTSPNDGKAYGLMSDWNGGVNWVAVIDLQALMNAARTSGTHSVAPSVNLIANGIVRYVATH